MYACGATIVTRLSPLPACRPSPLALSLHIHIRHVQCTSAPERVLWPFGGDTRLITLGEPLLQPSGNLNSSPSGSRHQHESPRSRSSCPGCSSSDGQPGRTGAVAPATAAGLPASRCFRYPALCQNSTGKESREDQSSFIEPPSLWGSCCGSSKERETMVPFRHSVGRLGLR